VKILRNIENKVFWMFFLSWLIFYIGWYFGSKTSTLEAQRYLALKGAQLAVVIPSLIATVYLADLLTPGNWLEKIEESSDACAKVTIAIILGAAFCIS
jgi:hypothetical protein